MENHVNTQSSGNEIRLSSEAFVQKLNWVFSEKRKTNPKYSVRSFSKMLKLDSGTLSRILAGQRKPTEEVVGRVSRRLELVGENKIPEIAPEYRELTLEEHLKVDQWQVAAIQELTSVRGFQSDSEWIAKKLSLTTEEVSSLIEFLISIQQLARRDDGRLYDPVGSAYTMRYEHLPESKEHNRKKHRELNRISEKQYEKLDPAQYSFSQYMVAADRSKVETAKKMIHQFRRELGEFLGHPSSDPTDVYVIKIDLFPVNEE